MSDSNRNLTRRSALMNIGAGVLASAALSGPTSGANAASPPDRTDAYESLRGTANDPVEAREVERVRQEFIGRRTHTANGPSNHALLDPVTTFREDEIIGYNVFRTNDGTPREQFVTRRSIDGSTVSGPDVGIETESGDSGSDSTARLRQEADNLLQEAVESETASTSSADKVATTSWDIDWDDWYTYGSTDVYVEFSADAYADYTGAVKFVNEVRSSPDDPRLAARSKVRMEPGRQLCNDGFDGYCTSSIQTGYRNKAATVHHDWDQPVNDTPTDELIVGTDPEGQISDVTGTRSASIGLELSRDPSLSIGYTSGVSFPGAELRDKTSLMSGRSEHEFMLNSPESPSAANVAVFEVGSASRFDRSCNTSYIAQRTVLDVHVDLEWGLNNWGWWTPHTEEATKSFEYVTWCP